MSLVGFAKVILKSPETIRSMGVKQGVGYVTKESIAQVGKIPAIAGVIAYPIGAVAGCAIPCTGLLTALTVATVTKGAMKAPTIIKGIAKKSTSIFSK